MSKGGTGFRFRNIDNFFVVKDEEENGRQGAQFSFVAWFMLTEGYPWDGGEDMDIVYVKDRIRCMITVSKTIECLDKSRFSSERVYPGRNFGLEISEDQVLMDEWYLIVLSSGGDAVSSDAASSVS